MPFERTQIPPNPPRWQPNPDPDSIEIPGLDTTAPPGEQIEQIEQLITLKLQNIDENFSKIYHILSTRILPAVKRYAVGTEPVREAAKIETEYDYVPQFWVSFYEQAAQIRIPTYEEEEEPQPSEHNTTEQDTTETETETETESGHSESIISSATDSSFMPSHGAFSSTPATNRVVSANQSARTDDASTWSTSDSLESPMVRLDRELKNFSREDLEGLNLDVTGEASTFRDHSSSSLQDTVQNKGKGKGKGKEPEPLLHSILRNRTVLPSSDTPHLPISPLRPRKLKTPSSVAATKELNPYLPPKTKPGEWSGVVDLRDPSITTPKQYRPRTTKPSSSSRIPTKPILDDDDDDSFGSDGLPPGMSPPRFMSPARPKPSSGLGSGIRIGQTPRREAIARITQDAISDVQSVASGSGSVFRYHSGGMGGGTESSMSTILTPPSLSKYNRDTDTSGSMVDTSLESMMRRVGLKGSGREAGEEGDWYGYGQQDASPAQNPEDTYDQPGFITPNPHQGDEDDDDDDSFDDTAHPGPSAAFLMASQNSRGDDSFDRSDDSLDADADANMEGMAPVHPFARTINLALDDSFDDDDSYEADMRGAPTEETLFGVPPGEREQHAQGLRMHGGNLVDLDVSMTGDVGIADTPTPAMR
ncbi:DASH complex subunit ask1 [Marasmius crinis-equi]|uniref:DASH complex subunit ASK1 n=1 Tax=Marasmius crinis-equi TaxID=585013 RepID=A0ABR3FJ75_9AGAR